MSFPPRPETDEERRIALLRLMEVPGNPRLYVLGCFARYVTVYAQQVRAFNLIDALAKSGYLTARSKLAVIGGGIAGLTAAAAAAVRGVPSVTIFEKEGNTMRLQRGTEKRFLHPHIYDWPAEKTLAGVEKIPAGNAGHSLLDWKAGTAANVVQTLDKQWEDLRKQYPALQSPRLECKNLEVEPNGKGWRICIERQPAGTFDIVLLAVGFGRDSTPWTEGYWTDTSLDGLEAESGGKWLVSGYGDGGLTDLMRLCIMDFRHMKVLDDVNQLTRRAVGSDLLEAERKRISPEDLSQVFLEAARKIKPDLDSKLQKRKLGNVFLNCLTLPQLFSGQSSILNRLIVAYLYLDKRFKLLKDGGEIASVTRMQNGRYRIAFKGGQKPFEADRIVLRHGPQKVLASDFPWIWERCQRLEAKWKSARQHEDWTRELLYSPEDFKPNHKPSLRLRVDFGNRIGCTVITGSQPVAGESPKKRLKGALERLKAQFSGGRFGGREIETEPEHISAAEALSSLPAYERTVRALCDSDIAVFDITALESAVMLFLGIRAAVRRGVTLTLSQEDSIGRLLPFNLVALNPIHLGDKEERAAIATSMEIGLASLRAQPEAYLDLPAFDAVRSLGEDHRPQPPSEQILVLRWFDEQYSRLVRHVVEDAVVGFVGAKPTVVTTLDSRSPQLVSQRLYAAIRRTQLCIADWTGWRPNVFFEIGVRLAVNRIDPVHILCKELPPGWKEELSQWPNRQDPLTEELKAFFAPVLFTFEDDLPIGERFQKNLTGTRVQEAKLPSGRTYQVICESIPRELEPGGQRVDVRLMSEAERIAGPAGPEEGGFPLLYSDVLADQARRSAVELLLAAWYYLDRRNTHGGCSLLDRLRRGELDPADRMLQQLRIVGQALSARFRNVPGGEYRKIAQEIRDALAVIEKSTEVKREP